MSAEALEDLERVTRLCRQQYDTPAYRETLYGEHATWLAREGILPPPEAIRSAYHGVRQALSGPLAAQDNERFAEDTVTINSDPEALERCVRLEDTVVFGVNQMVLSAGLFKLLTFSKYCSPTEFQNRYRLFSLLDERKQLYQANMVMDGWDGRYVDLFDEKLEGEGIPRVLNTRQVLKSVTVRQSPYSKTVTANYFPALIDQLVKTSVQVNTKLERFGIPNATSLACFLAGIALHKPLVEDLPSTIAEATEIAHVEPKLPYHELFAA